jgi:hypothetical protein
MNQPKPKRKIASRVETIKRIYQIYQWVCEGHSTNKIVTQCREMYGIRRAMTERLLTKARELLTQRMQKDMSGQASDIIKKLDAIHEKAFEEGITRYSAKGEEFKDFDLSTARQVQIDKAKILGLLTNKIDMTVNDERENTREDSDTLESIANQVH